MGLDLRQRDEGRKRGYWKDGSCWATEWEEKWEESDGWNMRFECVDGTGAGGLAATSCSSLGRTKPDGKWNLFSMCGYSPSQGRSLDHIPETPQCRCSLVMLLSSFLRFRPPVLSPVWLNHSGTRAAMLWWCHLQLQALISVILENVDYCPLWCGVVLQSPEQKVQLLAVCDAS